MAIESKVSGSGMIDTGTNLIQDIEQLASAINNLDSKLKDAKNNLSDNIMREAEGLIVSFKNILNEMKKGTEELTAKLIKAGKKGQHIERGL